MKLGKKMALIMVVLMGIGGCARWTKESPTTKASGDTDYRRVRDLCEQEARGRCWDSAESSPVWLNEIWESLKQSNCKKKWTASCMERHGYGEKP